MQFEELLNHIIMRVENSTLVPEKKQKIYAQISIGLHKLVWSSLITHIPEEMLKKVCLQSQMTVDQYVDCIKNALRNPETPKIIHTSVTDALQEIDTILTESGIPQIPV